jgi:hypothetical protein
MRTARWDDLVQVHYLILSQDGSMASSRGRSPLELTVGAVDLALNRYTKDPERCDIDQTAIRA